MIVATDPQTAIMLLGAAGAAVSAQNVYTCVGCDALKATPLVAAADR
jgi:hypothetical protein